MHGCNNAMRNCTKIKLRIAYNRNCPNTYAVNHRYVNALREGARMQGCVSASAQRCDEQGCGECKGAGVHVCKGAVNKVAAMCQCARNVETHPCRTQLFIINQTQ